MKHILPYSEVSDTELISKYFKENEQVITSALAVENLTWESNLLNSVESVLSENLSFDLHFDMIVNEGRDAILNYYNQFSTGSNAILEKAKRYTNDLDSINESIELLKNELRKKAKSFLNEQTAALGGLDVINQVNQLLSNPAAAPAPKPSAPATAATPSAPTELDASFDKALGGAKPASAEGDWSSWSGIYTKIKNLLSAITEGGSPIGIIHLLLDLASFIPEIGPLFDIFNACIYFYRGNQPNAPKGMWLLGTISLVSGLTFGAGQVFKGLRFGAKGTAEVMEQMAKGGSKAGIEALSKIPAKEKGLVMRFLSFLARTVGTVVGKAMSILGKASQKIIAKLSSYIPFIGKPLEKVFGMIGTTLTKYGERMAKFSKDFAEVEKGVAKGGVKGGTEAVAKESVSKMIEKGGIMEVDAKGIVTILDKDGKMLGKYPKEAISGTTVSGILEKGGIMEVDAKGLITVLDKEGKEIAKFPRSIITDLALWEKKAPGVFAKGEEEIIVGYVNGASRAEKLSAAAMATKLLKTAAKTVSVTTKFMVFLGKQVVKLMFGESALTSGKYTEKELEYWGNSAFNSYMDNLRKKQEEETGATYVPAVVLDGNDQEAFEHITKYQQNYAKLTGQPDIITAVYDKYGSQGTENQFKDFWNSVAEGKVKRDGEGDKIEHESDKPKNESFSRLRYITPFSKFSVQ